MRAGLTVGEFSRVTHLSAKTLRHYHDVGLLEPADVDSSTGYRYYSLDQVPAAQVIRRLRDLDMPVADVRAVLSAEDVAGRNKLIAVHLDRLEAKLVEARTAVDALRDLLRRSPAGPVVEHRSVPAQPAIGIRAVIDRVDVLSWWQGALGELNGIVGAQRLHRTGPSGGLFDSDLYEHERGEAVVFVPVDGAVRPVGRVTDFVVPAAELAVTVHEGPLDDIDLTYGDLGTYAARHEIGVTGPLREYYLRDPIETSAEREWRTEVGWPIFRSDSARG
ncbi:MerR family transcriptional regulator [Amycolatopsis sp. NPDC049252]|uniref:MerR family transcriptional regulator n=1 Tax=Amycolatopsis sp. NPDC049252 TaxID=3363933 RepID=UPI003718B718